MTIRFSGESQAYRQARDKLLEAELALRGEMERVAELRRQLPLGREAAAYRFRSADAAVTLASLFAPDKDTLLLYSYMFGPDASTPCPMCTAYLDGLDGLAPHLRQRMNLAVVAGAPPDRLRDLARERGWRNLQLLSAAGTTYQRDYLGENEAGAQQPMCNIFVRRGGQIFHYWCSEMFFAESPWHPRHIDLLFPLWSHLDLTPEGRGDFFPALSYPN